MTKIIGLLLLLLSTSGCVSTRFGRVSRRDDLGRTIICWMPIKHDEKAVNAIADVIEGSQERVTDWSNSPVLKALNRQ